MRGSAEETGLRGCRAAAALLVALAAAAGAAADTLRAQGDTLRGQVVQLTSDGVHFQPVYGEGAIVVPFADVEDLRTDSALWVLHGDADQVHGRIVGVEEGRILVGEDPATAQRVDVGAIFDAYPSDEATVSTYEALRRRFRYWSASLDGGAALIQSTTDNATAFVRLRAERRQGRTRLLADGSFRYGSENPRDEPRDVTANILTGRVRGEYDLSDRTYGFAVTRASHDADQHISLRLEPRGGVGVRILQRDTMTLSADVGVGWIYEDFFGSTVIPGMAPLTRSRGNDNYWTVTFGTDYVWELPFGAIFRASGDYLPAVDAWTVDYILRGESSLEFPLVEWLSFDVAVVEEYDNTPAEASDRNKLTLTAGLGLRF